IVIIVADTIEGNGGRIVSNGMPGGTAVGIAGSGGGGAGGSIALYVRNFGSSQLKLVASGGNGGDNPGTAGPGGGGGGGLIYVNNNYPANVTDSISGGLAGNYLGPDANADGATGEKRLNFLANLNGFLFNTIESSVTGNQVDSICSGTLPPKITGTQPLGGTLPYTYTWEKSYDAAFTAPITLSNDPDPVNYTPTSIETATVWFRRTITDNSIPAIVDISKPVMIIVQSQIQNNVIVANPDTICINTDPALITQGTPDLTYPSQFLKYVWQDSTVGGSWSSPLATEITKEYDPNPAGGLTKDTWYRRTVISGRCRDNTAIVKFTVLQDIGSNGFVQLNDTICFGGNTDLATVAGPTGGDINDYRYIWQQSTTDLPGSWSSIGGATQKDYDPDASVSLPAGDHFYRRIVLSGEQDACKDTSGAATRKVWPVITNNLIQADQTIGYDSIPLKLTQSAVPAGGAGLSTFNYSWVRDTAGFPAAPGPGATNQAEYQPPHLSWTTSFRRRISSSACTDLSNPVLITVDARILNTISFDNILLDTIYIGQASSSVNGSVPSGGSANPSDGYSVSWYSSTADSPGASDWTPVTGTDLQYNPGILTESTWIRRAVSSPAIDPRATVSSNQLRIIVLPALVNVGISADQSICSGTRPLRINGDNMLSGGDGIYTFTWQDSTSLHGWQDITGYLKSDSANYRPPVLTFSSAYRRIVYSGKNDCGVANSNPVMIVVNPMPGQPDAGADQTIYSINKTILMDAAPPLAGETGKWTILGSGSVSIVDPAKYNTEVKNLSQGANSFLWTVTTDAGQCSLSDTVSVFLNKDFVPRAFSPNGDGINDKFIIEGLNLSENIDVELKILNGAGSVVFTTSNTGGSIWEDWDGRDTRGKDLPEGTYYYLFKMTSGDRVDMKTGFIILKRN
ncbi:MAG TPA: gliding motility-associated C-terminal domain-containing protein, partial [Bacteroidales bacterium]|nr:gliding motility-associated C-terminal domain-containing protein [Bacteroidales bacterium]